MEIIQFDTACRCGIKCDPCVFISDNKEFSVLNFYCHSAYYLDKKGIMYCPRCTGGFNRFGGYVSGEWKTKFLVKWNPKCEHEPLKLRVSDIIDGIDAEQSDLLRMLPEPFGNNLAFDDLHALCDSLDDKIDKLAAFVSTTAPENCSGLIEMTKRNQQIRERLKELQRHTKLMDLLDNENVSKALDIIGEKGFVEKLEEFLHSSVLITDSA
jgi:hypothetical protein